MNFRVVLCQMNSTVGDLKGNAHKIIEFYKKAVANYFPDVVVFPECVLPGYPPEDLLLRDSFLECNALLLKQITQEIKKSAVIIGFAERRSNKIFNSAAVIKNGKMVAVYSKHHLPNYGVFDEKRYFTPGKNSGIVKIKEIPVGLSICEDIWIEDEEKNNPVLNQSKLGAKILINISASPFYAGRFNERLVLLRNRVKQTQCPVIYVNLVGGQDELIFDGRSMAVDEKGKLRVIAKSFEEDLKVCEFEIKNGKCGMISEKNQNSRLEPLLGGVEEIYSALVLGTKDYVMKNGFKNAALGISGGIDSALTACIAVDALGKEQLWGVTMPSPYSSAETKSDAERIAKNLGIKFSTISITGIFEAYLNALSKIFDGKTADVTEENLQPRIRGMILMAISNKFGHLILTTGNKSEISVGYSTLYGDTAGGFAVLKDVPKGMVYQLSEYVNKKAGKELIPLSTIHRAPTAELKHHQTDQDTLPPYPLLDDIIQKYVEEDQSIRYIIKKGISKDILLKTIKMIDVSEYKRRQSPPGVKITPKSFGKDRRMPITNRFSEF